MPEATYEQRGYLMEDFRLFHLSEPYEAPIDWHYHTFHKLILFLNGQGAYAVEGKRYPLRQGDVVLVGSGCIHRPEPKPGAPYERYVLYISPEFLRREQGEAELELCFRRAEEKFSFVARPAGREEQLLRLFRELEMTQLSPGFGQKILEKSVLLKLLITLTRGLEDSSMTTLRGDLTDPRIMELLRYICGHLTQPLTVDALSRQFSMSKYHLMRRFKEETGHTIHHYLTSKRLVMANSLITEGIPPSAACYRCGFQDYSAFSRAYRKQFGHSPRNL